MIDGAALLTIRNAVENASDRPITAAQIVAILRGAGGTGSQMRAVFGDVSLAALARAGTACGVEVAAILAAYRIAKETARMLLRPSPGMLPWHHSAMIRNR